MDLLALQNDVLILAILLLLGYVAREVIKPLQKLYILHPLLVEYWG